MNKQKIAGLVMGFAVLGLIGCAQKTESEKLQDEMKKAQRQLSKDMDQAADQLKREADAWK